MFAGKWHRIWRDNDIAIIHWLLPRVSSTAQLPVVRLELVLREHLHDNCLLVVRRCEPPLFDLCVDDWIKRLHSPPPCSHMHVLQWS